jgi:hypothetical protein
VFLIDLKKQLTDWIQAGDQIVVGIDANDDLQAGPVNSISMHDAIRHQYPIYI